MLIFDEILFISTVYTQIDMGSHNMQFKCKGPSITLCIKLQSSLTVLLFQSVKDDPSSFCMRPCIKKIIIVGKWEQAHLVVHLA